MIVYTIAHFIHADSERIMRKRREGKVVWKTAEETSQSLVDAHHRPQNQSQMISQSLSPSRKSEVQTLFWTILREEASEMVQQHEEEGCITCPQHLQVDVGCGDNDPYVTFRLHPYGLFEDKGKNMTLFLKIIIPDVCPPIHPSTKLHLTVRVYTMEGKKRKQLHVHKLESKINSCVLYIPTFIPHKELQKIDSKELDIQISVDTGKYTLK